MIGTMKIQMHVISRFVRGDESWQAMR